MGDIPRSLREFETRFPDDLACARWLLAKRWADGFRCPACGHDHGWELGRGVVLIECAKCHRQTSVTAGTTMHRSHLPLKTWFLAAWLVATHKNGISARQLWLQLGLGSYKTAWLLLAKLRRAMVDPERTPLGGLVEVDETSIPLRTKDDPITAKPGRSSEGKKESQGAHPCANAILGDPDSCSVLRPRAVGKVKKVRCTFTVQHLHQPYMHV